MRAALLTSVICSAPPVQPPDQVAVDRAEGQLAGFGSFARAGDILQQPGDFRAGEVGVSDQPGRAQDRLVEALGFERVAEGGGAAVLPDDGVMDGLAAAAVPDQGGFALAADADGGDIGGVAHDILRDAQLRIPDFTRIMLDPARLRIDLPEFALGAADDIAVMVKEDGAG